MVGENTDFYAHVDNFDVFSQVLSKHILGDISFLRKAEVTIAIPTFNRPKLLKEAIDSALNQDYEKDYCIIVVDNDNALCAGNPTYNLIKEYNNPIIQYYQNERNIGMFGNQNRCFELPESEYIVLLHDDDLLLPDFLSCVMAALKEHPYIDGLQPRKYFWFEKKENVPVSFSHKRNGVLKRVFDFSNYASFVAGTQSCGIFRKSAIKRIGGFNSDYYPTSDYCFSIQFSAEYKMYILKDILAIYRITDNASTKIEVLKKFILNDYYLRGAIMKKHHFNRFSLRVVNNYVARKQIKSLNIQFNDNFTYDLKDLNGYFFVPKFIYIFFRLYYTLKIGYIEKCIQSCSL